MYVPSSVSTQEKVTCATATVFPIGDGRIHGKKLIQGHMKVSVIKVVDFYKTMELPVPDDEFPTLLNAVKGFIQWPISAIARFKVINLWNLSLCVFVVSFINIHKHDFAGIDENPIIKRANQECVASTSKSTCCYREKKGNRDCSRTYEQEKSLGRKDQPQNGDN